VTQVQFATYQPPGVYVEESPIPIIEPLGLSTTIIGLIGPSISYRENTEAVTLLSVNPVTLTKSGIDQTSITVRTNKGVLYASSNYDLVESAGPDEIIGPGNDADNITTIARSVTSTIPDGSIVVVSYRYTDTTFFDPILVQDYDNVRELFGDPFDEDGAIQSPLTLAARVAFANGAVRMYLLATPNPVVRDDFADAYEKLVALPEINVIVPLPVDFEGTDGSPGDLDNLATDFVTHLNASAEDNAFRVGLLSYDIGVARTPTDSAAQANSKRVMLCWPYRFFYFNGQRNETLEVGGFYAAAGYAGRLATLEFQDPLTRKQLGGFAGMPTDVLASMTADFKNELSAGGVAVTERTRDSRLVMRHGVMTDITSNFTKELSLVRARDALVDQLQRTFDRSGIIGTAIDPETPARLKAMAHGVLEQSAASNLINSYRDVKVRQVTENPTVMEIKFEFKPSYPLNYVLVVFSIDTSTGEIELLPTETP
jgi:hypothetical protein